MTDYRRQLLFKKLEDGVTWHEFILNFNIQELIDLKIIVTFGHEIRVEIINWMYRNDTDVVFNTYSKLVFSTQRSIEHVQYFFNHVHDIKIALYIISVSVWDKIKHIINIQDIRIEWMLQEYGEHMEPLLYILKHWSNLKQLNYQYCGEFTKTQVMKLMDALEDTSCEKLYFHTQPHGNNDVIVRQIIQRLQYMDFQTLWLNYEELKHEKMFIRSKTKSAMKR